MKELVATMVPKSPHTLTPEFKKAALKAANKMCANVTFQENGTIKLSKPIICTGYIIIFGKLMELGNDNAQANHEIECVKKDLHKLVQTFLVLDEMYN